MIIGDDLKKRIIENEDKSHFIFRFYIKSIISKFKVIKIKESKLVYKMIMKDLI